MPSLRLTLAAACAACAAWLARATPYPGYYYPSSMQVGTKVRVLIGGTGMGGVRTAYVTGEGVKVTKIVHVPGFPRAPGRTQPAFIINWLYDLLEDTQHRLTPKQRRREPPPEALIEETDWQECSWWFYLDDLDDLELQIVARWWCTPERYPQATPALDQIVILDVEADRSAPPGRRDIIVCDGGSASAPCSFFVTKEPHVAEKFFVPPTREGYKHRKLPACLHIPTDIKPQALPIWIDGQNWPGETDSFYLRLEEGQNLVCSFIGRELKPYLGDAVPGWYNPMVRLYNAKNEEVAQADDFYYLPDPVLTYKVPEDGFYRLDVFDNLFRGRNDFVYIVHCYNAPNDAPPYTQQERAFICFPPPAAHVPPKATATRIVKKGTLDIPGRSDRHFLDIKEPGEWHFELFARRQGSPLDGVMKLYGPMGDLPLSAAPKRAEWDDNPNKLYELLNVGDDNHPIIKTNMLYVGTLAQVECDPVGVWKFTDPGRYCLVVEDRYQQGGEGLDYTLVMEPHKPTFEVYSTASAFVARGGTAARFKANLLRRGLTGPITFDSTDEWEVSGEFTEENQVETEVTVTSKKGPWEGVKRVTLTASGEAPDGSRVTVRVTPCDRGEQAFAYTHCLPQECFFFCAPGPNLVFPFPHPGPHLTAKDGKGGVKKKASHSNGQACISCHSKRKKGHPNGKDCTSCHKDRN